MREPFCLKMVQIALLSGTLVDFESKLREVLYCPRGNMPWQGLPVLE
jgi:hypothetical protein